MLCRAGGAAFPRQPESSILKREGDTDEAIERHERTRERGTRGSLELDEHDRAEVAGVLLESLEVKAPEEEAAFLSELERRAARMESGTVRGIPWQEL